MGSTTLTFSGDWSFYWQSLWKSFWKTRTEGVYETEVITVDGEEHEVRKRDDHTFGNNFMAAAFWVSIHNHKFIHLPFSVTNCME